jgi:MoxR-like ATPase
MPIATATRLANDVLDEVERAVVGQRRPLELALTAVLANVHVLIEDLPGLGKTLLARSLSTVLGCQFTRVQHTPDLLPSDLTGVSVFDQRTSEFSFRPGPVFTNLLLADEINRTPPKTQAALLEAMAERQVTVDGETRPLPDPFVVFATQNPIEYEGTYPLPEAQLDRFGLRIRLGYLDQAHETELVTRRLTTDLAEPKLSALADPETVQAMRSAVNTIEIDPDIVDYCVRLVAATRGHPQLEVGASPRGTLTLVAAGRAAALLAGRDYVVPDDVAGLAVPALGHRIVLRPELWARRITGDAIIGELLEQTAAPAAETNRAH